MWRNWRDAESCLEFLEHKCFHYVSPIVATGKRNICPFFAGLPIELLRILTWPGPLSHVPTTTKCHLTSFTYRSCILDVRNYMDTHRCDFGSPVPPRTRQSPTSLKAFQQFQWCNLSQICNRQVKSGSSHLLERLLITRKLPFSLPDCDLGPSILGTLPTCAWLWGCDETEHLVMEKQLRGDNTKCSARTIKAEKKESTVHKLERKKRIKEIANIIANIEILIYRNLIYLLKKDRPWRINPTPRHTTAAEELQTRPWNGRGPRPQSWNRSLRKRFRRFLGDRTTAAWTS